MFAASNRTQNWLALGIVVAALVGLYGLVPYASGYGADRKPIVYWLWYFWRSPEWQHGALVPFIIVGLIWNKRETIAKVPLIGKSSGLLLIGLALLLFFAGHRSNIYYIGYASCHVMVVGLVLWLAGWSGLRALAFPVCFLVFLWPLYFLESQIGFPLRMIMTDLSSSILEVMRVDHLKLGTAIVSAPDTTAGLEKGSRFALEVANPCSGIRSLFALMMVGGLYGYLVLPKAWQWLAMCLSAIGFAIVGNVARILILTGGSIAFGTETAVGSSGETSTFHFMAGIAVFLVALSGLFGFAKLLFLTGWAGPASNHDPVAGTLQPEA